MTKTIGIRRSQRCRPGAAARAAGGVSMSASSPFAVRVDEFSTIWKTIPQFGVVRVWGWSPDDVKG
ncbi:hypothetical protein GCM10017788_37520 [Amycolatopsis acidiphila]|nr:hypothetical protein GCM10017788_37520 [Amycolatopsis acidiphila]